MSNIIDKHISKKIDKLLILGRVDNYNAQKNRKYLCQCDCGNTVTKSYDRLHYAYKNNTTTNCGCISGGAFNKGLRRSEEMFSKIGEKYNRLLITDIIENKNTVGKQIGYKVITLCDCGTISKKIYADLKSNKVVSCGCYGREQQSITGSKVWINNSTKQCSKRKWGIEKGDTFVKMRSGYEVMYALILNKENIKWTYEPKCFKLKEGMRYTPDFYLPETDEWIDTKGWLKKESEIKYSIFKKQGFKLNLVYLKELEFRLGYSYYKFKKNWDSKKYG